MAFKRSFMAGLALAAAAVLAAPMEARAGSINSTVATALFGDATTLRFGPTQVPGDAGGRGTSSHLGQSCAGYVGAEAPDHRMRYSDPKTPITFSAVTDLGHDEPDLFLLVRAPNGRFYCSGFSHAPAASMEFLNPPAGEYAVWIGRRDAPDTAPATLYVTQGKAARLDLLPVSGPAE